MQSSDLNQRQSILGHMIEQGQWVRSSSRSCSVITPRQLITFLNRNLSRCSIKHRCAYRFGPLTEEVAAYRGNRAGSPAGARGSRRLKLGVVRQTCTLTSIKPAD